MDEPLANLDAKLRVHMRTELQRLHKELDTTIVYLVGGTILFFFWAYGIVSFALDLKHKIVPGVRQYLRGRRRLQRERREEEEREERREQLY